MKDNALTHDGECTGEWTWNWTKLVSNIANEREFQLQITDYLKY